MKSYYSGIRILKHPKTKEDIGVMWYFADGTVSRFYPDDIHSEWFVFLLESIREENNLDRKTKYHEDYSLDGQQYESPYPERVDHSPAVFMNIAESDALVQMFLDTLTPIQLRRLSYRFDNPKISLREISRIESANHKAATKTFNQIKKKLDFFIEAHDLYWLKKRVSTYF